MTDALPPDPRDRSDVPDPESAAPVRVPEPRLEPGVEDEAEVAAARGGRRSVRGAPAIDGALLPGAGHAFLGRAGAGTPWLLMWVALVAIAIGARHRILAAPRVGALDLWIAVATLAVSLALVWWLAWRDLHSGGAGPAAGDSQWRIAMRHFRRNRLP